MCPNIEIYVHCFLTEVLTSLVFSLQRDAYNAHEYECSQDGGQLAVQMYSNVTNNYKPMAVHLLLTQRSKSGSMFSSRSVTLPDSCRP
jgi:hypothetical protein